MGTGEESGGRVRMLTERDVVSLELLDVGGVGVGENCEGESVC